MSKTAKQVREVASRAMDRLDSGTINHQQAIALSRLIDATTRSAKNELAYQIARGEVPNIDHFKN